LVDGTRSTAGRRGVGRRQTAVEEATTRRRGRGAGRQQLGSEVPHGRRATQRPGKSRQQVGKDRWMTPRTDAAFADRITATETDRQPLRNDKSTAALKERSQVKENMQ